MRGNPDAAAGRGGQLDQASLAAWAGELERGVPSVPDANGETDYRARVVSVRPDLEPAQALKTLIHEL